ncbi:hypothetical protein BDV30DRAFT_18014 [Aspergillus minisclerotigenes]|uniref:Uncharacterized protein n=1 Tax=Aspergillus minisclerotigenes TaxID=656917 RepID=A0A5N6IQ08_9EURO|nr:hypothetical protein BDV30DRAFT_18014 [Aspergillus minisclerotigenes]
MIPHMNTLTPEPNEQWHLHREMMLFHLATLQTLNFVKERDLDSCITYQFREYTIVLGYPHTQPLALDHRNIAVCRVDAFHSSEFMISLCPTNLSAESLLTPTTGTRPAQVVTSMATARPGQLQPCGSGQLLPQPSSFSGSYRYMQQRGWPMVATGRRPWWWGQRSTFTFP